MTRINVVPPGELTDKHLVAEYRELPRVFGLASKYHLRLTGEDSVPEAPLPTLYTLGQGHVRFFYDRLTFLWERSALLVHEMQRRGFHPKFEEPRVGITGKYQWRNYKPTKAALRINRERIASRLSEAASRSRASSPSRDAGPSGY